MVSNLKLFYADVGSLKVYDNNAKKHSEQKIKTLAKTIDKLGFKSPILVNEDNVIISGHCRLEAAKLLGMKELPVILVGDLTDEEFKAYVLSENRIAEIGSDWDYEKLSSELAAISDLGFDIELIGFNEDFIITEELDEINEPYYTEIEEDEELQGMVEKMKSNSVRAIQIEFDLGDYEEAYSLINKLRSEGVNIGSEILTLLKSKYEG